MYRADSIRLNKKASPINVEAFLLIENATNLLMRGIIVY